MFCKVNKVNKDCTYEALVECDQRYSSPLPRGLDVGPTLVNVDDTGTIHVQIANFSEIDQYVNSRTVIAVLRAVTVNCNVVLHEHST